MSKKRLKKKKETTQGEERNGIYSEFDFEDSLTILKIVLCQGTQAPKT